MYQKIKEDRVSYEQSLIDLRIGCNLRGLSAEEKKIAEVIWTDVAQYRSAARKLTKSPWYTISHLDYSCDLYRWDNGRLEHIAKTSKHRVGQLMRNWENRDKIHPAIWDNYCNSGYITRRGLTATYPQNIINRISDIAQSHVDCDLTGKIGHDIRVKMRNA